MAVADERHYVVGIESDPHMLNDLLDDLRQALRGAEGSPDVIGFASVVAFADALRTARRSSPAVIVIGSQVGVEELVDDLVGLSPSALVIVLGVRSKRLSELMDLGRVHDVIGRPWRPAEVSLHPVVIDAFEQWSSLQPPTGSESVVLVGRASDPATYRFRDLFTRNPVPYMYMDRSDPAAERFLEELDAADVDTPIVITPDGKVLSNPTIVELWKGLGEEPCPSKDRYELAIVGAGPAGMAVAVNSASEGIDTVLLEFDSPGGQAGSSSRIENYVGFPSGVSGTEIARRALTQVRRMGAEPAGGTPVDRIVRNADGTFTIGSGNAFEVTCDVVVLAVGLTWAKLPVAGTDRFEGAGIFYGAARSEARTVAGKRVVVVGGANSAGQAAVVLADEACDVVIVLRGDSLEAKMSQYLVDQIAVRNNISVLVRTEVVAVVGDDHLRSVTIQGPQGRSQLDVAGMFVFIGARPRTDWLPEWIERDGHGFIVTGPAVAAPDAGEYATSQPGVFAVGDVRAGSVKRVASAIGEGSIVVPAIHRHLATTRKRLTTPGQTNSPPGGRPRRIDRLCCTERTR